MKMPDGTCQTCDGDAALLEIEVLGALLWPDAADRHFAPSAP